MAATCGTLLALVTRVPDDYPSGEVSAALAVTVAAVVVWGRIAAALLRASATQGGGEAATTYGLAAIPLAWVLVLMLLCGWAAIVLGVSAIAYSPDALNTSWAYEWALRNMWRVGVATLCCVILPLST